MHIGSFNLAKKAVFSHTTTEAFIGLPTAEQLDTVVAAFEADATLATSEFSRYDAACFVYLFRRYNALPVTREEVGLVEPAQAWAKTMPFVSIMALISQWPEEYAKVSSIAATIDYATVKDETFDERVAACVRDALGMGGLEFSNDPDVIGASDPIMKLFIEAVKFQLQTVTAPFWFNGTEVTETRSLYEIETLAEAEKQRERIEARRKYAAERAAKIRAEYDAKKAAAFARFTDPRIAACITGLNSATFETVREIVKAECWLDDEMKALSGGEPALLQQYMLTALNKEKPTWFREGSLGDLVIRNAPLKVKQNTPTRSSRAIHTAVNNVIERYGWAEVKKELEAIIASHQTN